MTPEPVPAHPPAHPPAPVASPCVDVCRMDAASGWCEGCLRTIDEIAQWSALNDDAKREIWSRLALRRAASPASVTTGTRQGSP